MSVWSFCPTQIQKKLSSIQIKNKGDAADLAEYKTLWEEWITNFKGCETKKEWAVCNGIHDAIINQTAYRSESVYKFYTFDTDYKFYPVILQSYNHEIISPVNINSIKPHSYVVVSQPNHEGNITPWFEQLKLHCKKVNTKIFLDCAFYGTTYDTLDTSDPVFDAVAFSLSKNFLLAGCRAGIVFGDDLAKTLTVPISTHYNYNYFNLPAVECAKAVLPEFNATYITQYAKPRQLEYCSKNNLTPADIWMWAFDKNGNKICITDFIKDKVQQDLDLN
jgi:histidinol-phosphate/aromatic aminotransferase/cobyric acid decarboxylase-like protein